MPCLSPCFVQDWSHWQQYITAIPCRADGGIKWSLLGGSETALGVTHGWVSNGCIEIFGDMALFVSLRAWCISRVAVKLWIAIPWAGIANWSLCGAARMCPWPALGWTLAPARLWSCTCGAKLELLPQPEPSLEPSQQNGFKQAAAANLLNVSTRNSTWSSTSSAAAGGKQGSYQCWFQVPGHAVETDTIQVTELIQSN